MYPRNASSPPPIAVGVVIKISDGTVQTTGVSVVVRSEDDLVETAGGGTLAVGASSGVWYYTPTQAESNHKCFCISIYKTGCIPAVVTVATSHSPIAGHAALDWEHISNPTFEQILSGTTIKMATEVATVLGSVGSVAGDVYGNLRGNVLQNVMGSVMQHIMGSIMGFVQQLATGAISEASIQPGAISASTLSEDAIAAIQADLATLVDLLAVKAKTDQLTFTIPLQVDANALTGGGAGNVGPGADACTMNIKVNGSNLPDADVWISSDSTGETVIAGTLQTDSAGNVTFMLDAGVTYYLWMQKDGYNSILGQSFTAIAD